MRFYLVPIVDKRLKVAVLCLAAAKLGLNIEIDLIGGLRRSLMRLEA